MRLTLYILYENESSCTKNCTNEYNKRDNLHTGSVRGNLAVSNFRKMSLPTYEIQIKDYGYRKFNKKIHIMEQNL